MTGDRIETAEDLDALPVGSIVRGHYVVRNPLRPAERTPATMDLFVTRGLLIAERYERAKKHAFTAFIGGFEVLHRPDAPTPQPAPVTDLRADIEALRENARRLREVMRAAAWQAGWDTDEFDRVLDEYRDAILAAHPAEESGDVTVEQRAAVAKIQVQELYDAMRDVRASDWWIGDFCAAGVIRVWLRDRADRITLGVTVTGEEADRPDACRGKRPPIVGPGYDCPCAGNPRCTGEVSS